MKLINLSFILTILAFVSFVLAACPATEGFIVTLGQYVHLLPFGLACMVGSCLVKGFLNEKCCGGKPVS
jgi:predicted small secreted protein